MRIGRRIAVAWEMLAARRHPFGLQGSHNRAAHAGHVRGIFREGPVADHGILRVGEDVEDRCVIEGDADGAQFRGERPAEALRERHVAAPAERGHRRPFGERRFQPRHPATFLVDAHPQRKLGTEQRGLVTDLGQLCRLGDVSGEENDAAEADSRASATSSTGKAWPSNPAMSSCPI